MSEFLVMELLAVLPQAGVDGDRVAHDIEAACKTEGDAW